MRLGGWSLRYNVCMKHEMGLQSKYFDYIKDGTKRIELRLFDEKRIWGLVLRSVLDELSGRCLCGGEKN